MAYVVWKATNTGGPDAVVDLALKVAPHSRSEKIAIDDHGGPVIFHLTYKEESRT